MHEKTEPRASLSRYVFVTHVMATMRVVHTYSVDTHTHPLALLNSIMIKMKTNQCVICYNMYVYKHHNALRDVHQTSMPSIHMT